MYPTAEAIAVRAAKDCCTNFSAEFEAAGAFIGAEASNPRRRLFQRALTTFEGISSPDSVTCFANWFDRERISPRSRFPRAVESP